MDLKSSINVRLETILKSFLYKIAVHYDLDYNDLCTFVESVNCKDKKIKTVTTCMHIMKNGKNKGKTCGARATANGYCGKHQNSVVVTLDSIMDCSRGKDKQPASKAKLELMRLLSTAVPQNETILIQTELGLLHEETDMIFDKNYRVIGRQSGTGLAKISSFEVELCEQNGWCYDEEQVEPDDSDSGDDINSENA